MLGSILIGLIEQLNLQFEPLEFQLHKNHCIQLVYQPNQQLMEFGQRKSPISLLTPPPTTLILAPTPAPTQRRAGAGLTGNEIRADQTRTTSPDGADKTVNPLSLVDANLSVIEHHERPDIHESSYVNPW